MNETTENDKSCTAKSIQIQTDFIQSMTHAILRFIDKNADCTKADAERSVFLSLGYIDSSIETDSDIDYFRQNHIMRRRDAIRTIRIKQMHKNVLSQFPTLSSDQVLAHLTNKCNELFLPSPSPPPHNVPCKLSQNEKHFQPIENKKVHKLNNLISTSTNCKTTQNVNYSINHIKSVNLNNATSEKHKIISQKEIILCASQHIKSDCLKDRYIETKNDYDAMDAVNEFHQNIFVYPPVSKQFFVCDDEVAQKIKLHKKAKKKKKSRKRKKFGSSERDSFESKFDAKQPTKKRIKMNVKRMRINKKRQQNVKRFHHQIRNKQLMEASEDGMEEDELSDIDSLNAMSNTHTTNNSVSNSI